MEKIFEQATRQHVRFEGNGSYSVEDLWDLSKERLDEIYRKLRIEQKKLSEDSLINKPTKIQAELELKLEIVQYIFQVKAEEEAKRTKSREIRAQRARISELIAKKKEESLEAKSTEELEQELTKLDTMLDE
jgi:hypothetical protein